MYNRLSDTLYNPHVYPYMTPYMTPIRPLSGRQALGNKIPHTLLELVEGIEDASAAALEVRPYLGPIKPLSRPHKAPI